MNDAEPAAPERVLWGAYPNAAFETLLRQGSTPALQAALRRPPASIDAFAQLRLLDRLRELQPNDANLLAAWIPGMLTSNRPGPVHAVTCRWPTGRGPAPAWRLVAAQVAQTMGARDEARARFRALLADEPGMIDAWQKYVEFAAPDELTDVDLARVRALHDSASDDYVREKSAFALARAWLHRDPPRAFRLAEQAHRLKRRRNGPWDAAALGQQLQSDRLRTAAAVPPEAGRRPVFVVGLPRSGTTVLTRILGSHPALADVGEQPLVPLWAARGRDIAAASGAADDFAADWYRAALDDLAAGARATVDKLPANAEHAGLILQTFPQALLVWIERDLADCAMSIYLHDFEAGFRQVDDPADLTSYARMLRRHLEHWQHTARGRVLHLRYEALVDEPQRVVAPILEALGLPWVPAMLDFWKSREQTATYSEAQVRRPLNSKAVGSWRRFLPDAAEFVRHLGVPA